MKMWKAAVVGIAGLGVAALVGACENDANVASRNISRSADMFEVNRRVVFFNGITNKILLEIIGRCSLGNHDTSRRMSVTCKLADGKFRKHFLGLSDNVSFFAEHLQPSPASVFHYRIIFKPQTLVPDIDLRMDGRALQEAVTPDNSDN